MSPSRVERRIISTWRRRTVCGRSSASGFDATHVLAGPFAAYQLAVLGADVIKVEHPDDPDQSRGAGTDKELKRRNMGTASLYTMPPTTFDTVDQKQECGS